MFEYLIFSIQSQRSVISTRSIKSGNALPEKELVEVEDDVEEEEMTGSGNLSVIFCNWISAI